MKEYEISLDLLYQQVKNQLWGFENIRKQGPMYKVTFMQLYFLWVTHMGLWEFLWFSLSQI